ncbi:MAG: hypothetical protein SGPRY_004646 [Prymnesium sp.]
MDARVGLAGNAVFVLLSLIHLGDGRRRLRSRAEPEGVIPVPRRWRAYIKKHNAFVRFSAEAAGAAQETKATYIFESPCGHTHREVRAIGINVDGACRAGEAAEYPVLFSASIACLLSQECDGMTAGVLRCALASPEAAALRDSVASDEVDRGDITIGSRAGKDGCFGGTATGVRGGATSSWKYSWEAMPQAWDEREDLCHKSVYEMIQEKIKEVMVSVSSALAQGETQSFSEDDPPTKTSKRDLPVSRSGQSGHLGATNTCCKQVMVTGVMDSAEPFPAKAVPRNVVRKSKWKVVEGYLRLVTKWRVTTDDSAAAGNDHVSRKDGIADEGLGNVDIPVLKDLGEAVVIVNEGGVCGSRAPSPSERVMALCALDLTSAYRMCSL